MRVVVVIINFFWFVGQQCFIFGLVLFLLFIWFFSFSKRILFFWLIARYKLVSMSLYYNITLNVRSRISAVLTEASDSLLLCYYFFLSYESIRFQTDDFADYYANVYLSIFILNSFIFHYDSMRFD